jgi:hypothetical protein
MLGASQLRRILSRFRSKHPGRRVKRPSPRFLPCLEHLEERATPSTYSASADNTLYQTTDATNQLSNGVGQHFYVGDTNQATNAVRRGLIKFDLSAIPQGSIINSVTLQLHLSKSSSGGAQTIKA